MKTFQTRVRFRPKLNPNCFDLVSELAEADPGIIAEFKVTIQGFGWDWVKLSLEE